MHRKLNGEDILVEVNIIYIYLNGKTTICALWKDITELYKAEKALYEKDEQYKRLVSSLPEIVLVHKEGKILFANQATTSILGYTPEEMLNTSVFDYAKEEYKSLIWENIQKRMNGEELGDYEIKMRTKKGEVLDVIVRAHKIIYMGAPAHLVVLFDITERKKTEEKLRQSQKMEAIGMLAGGIAHDFNNILMAIMGFGKILSDKLSFDDPLKVYVGHILSASEKAAQLTQSLLAFSRKQPINLKPINLNKIIKDIEKLLLRLLPEDIELKIELDENEMILMADTVQIEQVLINMAANAKDAMPNGGTLTIKTEIIIIDSEFYKRHGFGNEGEYAMMLISDTGIGMDEKTKDRVFEPFFTTKDVGQGTGLGLSTAYGIIKQHNGYITVNSVQGSGTTFKIYLPLTKSKSVEYKKLKTMLSLKGNETILVAEDDPAVRLLMKTILEEEGYKVIEARDGKEAVEVFEKYMGSIDMVVIDVVMPKKNGKEVCQEIRAIKKDIKFLFISGYATDVLMKKGVNDKNCSLITKPISNELLLQKIREMLDRPY